MVILHSKIKIVYHVEICQRTKQNTASGWGQSQRAVMKVITCGAVRRDAAALTIDFDRPRSSGDVMSW